MTPNASNETAYRPGHGQRATETTNDPFFKHEAIPDAQKQIRLLKFTDYDPSRTPSLECELQVHDMADNPSYNAISYTWGTSGVRNEILCNGKVLWVGENCHYALLQIHRSRKHAKTYIWIDGICIDQENNDEKSKHVAMTGQILSNEQIVLACIGPPADDSDFVVPVMRRLAKHDLVGETMDFAYGFQECIANIWKSTGRPSNVPFNVKCKTFGLGYLALGEELLASVVDLAGTLAGEENFNTFRTGYY